jgi:hypothetical protein
VDAIRTISVRELEGIGEVPDTRPADAPSRNFPDPDPSYETGQTPPLDLWPPAVLDHEIEDEPLDIEITEAPYDAVKNPPHYAQYAIQPIEFIIKNNIGYCVGNVIKYVCRYNLKDGIQDLKKAREYIDIMIKAAEDKL